MFKTGCSGLTELLTTLVKDAVDEQKTHLRRAQSIRVLFKVQSKYVVLIRAREEPGGNHRFQNHKQVVAGGR